MTADHRARLAKIRDFRKLVDYLRDEMDWPIPDDADCFEDLTFEYDPEELGIDAKNAAKIKKIRRLRPLSVSQPWGIFFVEFEPKRLPVVALRRILGQVALKKRASANKSERQAWAKDDLLFVSNYGEGEKRQISFAHFSEPQDRSDLPTLKVLGWDSLDTELHPDAVARELSEHLAWPDDENDVDAWRDNWRSAFTLRHREVITTSKELSARLAKLARDIRDRIRTAIAIETDNGPLTKLLKAFQEALIHDLDAEGFADMYAQTITYGLLSARIADPQKKTADDFAAHMRTNPFLRELMETFLRVGGRRGKAGGPGIDFDELGVTEVVDLLDDANMEAVVRDFGDKNPQEDPVLHFYEGFARDYDPLDKVKRGEFYTPRPAVSYIVRSVDELLRSEFSLEDGLADTTTWGQMAKRNKKINIPRGVSPDQDFVQILDPATGTGTFLVEVIETIYKTLVAKWQEQKKSAKDIEDLWNDYVPKHLLTRLHAYELKMAPYAIAHLKIGLKLYETGYRFNSDERARVYLSNALEPASDVQLRTAVLPALAHEAVAVNEIKRNKNFTAVIGNPPYSGLSANMTEQAQQMVGAYKFVDGEALGERKLWLQDDYVKFIRKAQTLIEDTGCGILGFITNHGYLSNPTFRGMRNNLLATFSGLRLLNLHGNANKKERSPDGSQDNNVFDIRQGVAICLATCGAGNPTISHVDIWGTREYKYKWLSDNSVTSTEFESIVPDTPFYFLEPQNADCREEYDNGWKISEIFLANGVGVVMARDSMTVDIDASTLWNRVRDFAKMPPEKARKKYGLGKDARDWKVKTAQADLVSTGPRKAQICRILYRPFDERYTYYTGKSRGFYASPCRKIMTNMTSGDNLGLVVTRSVEIGRFEHVFCTLGIIGHHSVTLKEVNYLCPLWLVASEEERKTLLIGNEGRRTNINPEYVRALTDTLEENSKSNRKRIKVTPEEIFGYLYALLFSPSYRSRYQEYLKSDFPSLPLTGNVELFRSLSKYGSLLVELHTMKSKALNRQRSKFFGRNKQITRACWTQDNGGTIWIDGKVKAKKVVSGTSGYAPVSEEVWNFGIGGYQVCERWLKDRKEYVLTKEDIDHYNRIIAAIVETQDLMKKIDKVIENCGGWPSAFVTHEK